MVTDTGTPVGQEELLAAARSGDEQAFTRIFASHRRALHVHCYRLLGSLHDADDALQETALKAWRSIGGFEPQGSFRAWMYRIATNVCLRALERRARQPEVLDPEEAEAVSHLQPYPDRLLESEVEERESIGLAFATVMQLLPPRQRAVLVLRDVLGWSAREVADLLGDSVASVNSALQRGRERLERERAAGRLARDHAPASSDSEARIVKQFLAAWEAVDVDASVSLLAEDAVMTMPPEPLRVVGRREIGDFFRTVLASGALEKIMLRPTRANGQPALAAYLESNGGEFGPYGLMVLALEGESVASITGFAGQPELFPRLGLPSGALMAYDERLAVRIRGVLADTDGVSGGFAVLIDGKMASGVVGDNLMLQLGREGAEEALSRPNVRPMDFTGRPMTGMVYVEPAGLRGVALRKWVERATAHARSLPRKVQTSSRSKIEAARSACRRCSSRAASRPWTRLLSGRPSRPTRRATVLRVGARPATPVSTASPGDPPSPGSAMPCDGSPPS